MLIQAYEFHELLKQRERATMQRNQRKEGLLEQIREKYQILIREIEICEEHIKNIRSLYSQLIQKKDDFQKKYNELIDIDIAIVGNSINSISKYKSIINEKL